MLKNLELVLLFLLFVACSLSFPATAQEKPAKRPDVKPAVKATAAMTKAREAGALAFVREHHPELESLLMSLKERQPKQYEAAIRDLFRQSERLASAQEKDSARYELELKAWKLQSRVQLLTATVLMTPQDEAAQDKLRDALVEQLQARRALLELERDQAAKRVERLDEQIKKLDADMQKAAERQLKLILQGPRPKVKVSN
jgi:hypothetical protein